jgi:hypothetical protein
MSSYGPGFMAVTYTIGTMAQQPVLHPVDPLPLRRDGLVLRQSALTGEPFIVAGPQGVLAGQQQGCSKRGFSRSRC